MSKFVKSLLMNDIQRRLEGVQDALLVNVIGMNANASVALRRKLRERNVSLLVVKTSLARKATAGTPLEPALDGVEGPVAMVWGDEDFISLAKTIVEIGKNQAEYRGFETRGGVMDGEKLTPERVAEISKWPNREEQLSILSGQILAPGAELSAALLGPGGLLASQIEQKSKEDSAA